MTDERSHPLRRDLLARRVDRREVGGRLAFADVVRLHVEAVAARLSAQAHVHARSQLLLEPWLVEPRCRDRGGAVGDARGDDSKPPAAPGADVQHLAGDRDLVLVPRAPRSATSSTADSYRRGRCSRRSRSVTSPSFASFRFSVAPTPGNTSSSRSSRRGCGAPRVAGQDRGWSSPAKTVCRRSAVIVLGARACGTLELPADVTSRGLMPRGDAAAAGGRAAGRT